MKKLGNLKKRIHGTKIKDFLPKSKLEENLLFDRKRVTK